MTYYTIGWLALALMSLGISIYSLRLYFLDYDKRKLMFSIIFFFSIFIFFFNAFNQTFQLTENWIFSNLFQWVTLPVMTALFIAVVESFSPSKDFERGFLFFIIFSLVTFSFIFLPFQIEGFLTYVRMSIALGIIPFSLYQFIKWKNTQSLLFLAAVGSFAVAGMAHASQQMSLSIFGYVVAYVFIALVFLSPDQKSNLKTKGISSYFSLQKQLDQTRSALKESKELYKSIVENTQDVILLTKPNGINSYVSPSSEHIFGYSPEEMMASNKWPITIHPDDEESVQKAMKKGYAGYPGSNLEYRIITKDDSVRWISHSWSPIKKDEEVNTIVSSIRDITELKQTERKLAERVDRLQKNELATLNIMEDFQDSILSLKAARKQIQEKNEQLQESEKNLKRLNDELEERVKDRTKEVNRLLKQKDSFIDQLGHDLKHPLGPLINLIPLLKKQEDDEKKIEILTVLERNVDYMKRLVIRTVRLAKLNAPSTTFDLKPIRFIDLIERVIQKNSSTFKENNVEVITTIDPDVLINVDPLQLEEVIENLFSNALKYGSKQGMISIKTEKYDNDFVRISIKDTGIGMNPDQLDEIFNEFYKADESRHDFSSTGLGLSICKKIVEKHGGKIWAESPGLGKGTIFHLTLPLVQSKKEEQYISA
jgi:PAS domain S-box-containing protein